MVFVARITPALFTRTVKRTKAIACRGDTGLPIGFDGETVAKIDGILGDAARAAPAASSKSEMTRFAPLFA